MYTRVKKRYFIYKLSIPDVGTHKIKDIIYTRIYSIWYYVTRVSIYYIIYLPMCFTISLLRRFNINVLESIVSNEKRIGELKAG